MKTILALLLAAVLAVGAVIWFTGRSAQKVTSTLLALPDDASVAVARANAVAAVPALEAFAAANGGYQGATMAGLQTINRSIGAGISLHDLSATSYCLQSTIGTATVSVTGPSGAIADSSCG